MTSLWSDVPRVLEVSIRGLPRGINTTRRRHWSSVARETGEWKDAAYVSTLAAIRDSGRADDFPIERASVSYTFLLRAERGDLDNLIASVKPILDGIVAARAIVDDSVRALPLLSATWRRASDPGVIVRIEESP
jgi:Holliday junction resolvase RusA-like endonuclease